MPKQYCLCGHPNEYTTVKPKFCGGCGKALDGQASLLANASVETPAVPIRRPQRETFARIPDARPKIRRRPEPVVEEYYDDDEESYEVNEIVVPEKWDMTVTINEVHKEKFENVLGQGSLGSLDIPGRSTKRVNKKERVNRLAALRERLQTMQRHDIGGE